MSTGKKINMHLHGAGVVSHEMTEVVDESLYFIMLYRGEQKVPWIFEKRTGKCVTDEKAFDFYRTITPIKNKVK